MTDQPPGLAILVYLHISGNPGVTMQELAQLFRLPKGRMVGLLTSLEFPGFLLSEDEFGGLYIFDETLQDL